MYKQVLPVTLLILGFPLLSAADKQPVAAKIVSESSVDCGTKKQGKKESTNLLCQEYTVRTATTEYKIRQQKPSSKGFCQPTLRLNLHWTKTK